MIQILNLQPLEPEGGFFGRTYENDQRLDIEGQQRSASSAIYYLITPTSFSRLHRLRFDEIFHFYAGDSVELIQIDNNGKLKTQLLGTNFSEGEFPQCLIKSGTWQGAKIKSPKIGWALLGTTNTPGFEFSDFELAEKDKLLIQFPHISETIGKFI